MGLDIRNLTHDKIDIRFESNTILAAEGAQGKDLDALQKVFQDFVPANSDLEEGWHRRELSVLEDRGYAGAFVADRIRSFQKEHGLTETGSLDAETRDAIDAMLDRSEVFRSRDPSLGKVLMIERGDIADDQPMFALYDPITGRPLLRADGTRWTSDRIEDIRQFLREESSKESPITSIFFRKFSQEQVDGFKTTVALNEMRVICSKAYYAPDAMLMEVGGVREESPGIFSAKLSFKADTEGVRVTFRSRFKSLIDWAVSYMRFTFGRRSSVESAILSMRKAAIQAGYKPNDISAEVIDNIGYAELVVSPVQVNRSSSEVFWGETTRLDDSRRTPGSRR